MKKIISLICLCAFIGMHNPVFAVNVPPNTSIIITPRETVTSKDKNVDTIIAEVTDDVVVNNVVVFKAGDKATLHIGEIEKARCWGNPGKITIVNGFVYDAKGGKHKIIYSKNYYGEEKTWPKVMGVASLFLLFPLALFGFVHGGQAVVSASSEIEVNLASQFEF